MKETWRQWAWRLARATHKARVLAPIATCPCHYGLPDPHTPRGRRWHRLHAACVHQLSAWYAASRYAGSRHVPEEDPGLARALRDA